MKNRNCLLTAVLTALLLLTACNDHPTGSTALISSDANMVVRICLPQAMAYDAQELQESLSRLMRKQDMSRGLRKQMERLLTNSERVGISTTEPFFFFTTSSKEAAVVGTVSNRLNLTNALNELADDEQLSAVWQESGFSLFQRDSIVCIFNDDSFYIGYSDDISLTARRLADMLDDGTSLTIEDWFTTMCAQQGAMQLLITGDGLATICDLGTLGDALPEDVEIDGVNLLFNVELKRGEATITTTWLPISEAWKQFIDDTDDMTRPIGRRQADYVTSRGMSLFLNTDGQQLYNMLEAVARAANAADEGTLQQLRTICNSLQGSMQADIYALRPSLKMNAFLATRDSAVACMVRELVLNDDSTRAVEPYQWVLIGDPYRDTGLSYFSDDSIPIRARFGFSNGYTYLVTDGTQPFALPDAPFPPDSIKGKGFYAWAQGRFLAAMADSSDAQQQSTAARCLSALSHAEAFYQGRGVMVVRMATAEGRLSPLAAILEELAE